MISFLFLLLCCFLRNIDENSVLMCLNVDVDRRELLSGFYYKYGIKPGNGGFIYEFIPNKHSDRIKDRVLTLTSERLGQRLGLF
jgi:hypothetical protein